MPRGRMINKQISRSEKVSQLPIEGQLLYTWMIPHADVEGRVQGDVWTIKALVPYVDKITPTNLPKLLQQMVDLNLILYYGNKHKYIQIIDFDKYQSLRKDQETPSVIPSPEDFKNNNVVTTLQQRCKNRHKVKDKVKDKEKEKHMCAFFSYFVEKTERQFKLTNDKKVLIRKKLDEGYTLDQLKFAVDRFVEDDWDGRKDHMDLIYCIGKQKGKPDNLEKWLGKIRKVKEFK